MSIFSSLFGWAVTDYEEMRRAVLRAGADLELLNKAALACLKAGLITHDDAVGHQVLALTQEWRTWRASWSLLPSTAKREAETFSRRAHELGQKLATLTGTEVFTREPPPEETSLETVLIVGALVVVGATIALAYSPAARELAKGVAR